MKTKLLSVALTGLLAIMMAGCSKETPVKNEVHQEMIQSSVNDYHFTGVPPAITLKKSGNTVTKTIKFFEISGSFEFDYTMEGCAPSPYLTLNGNGNASHIGHYTVVNSGCYDGESPIFGVITAANGDELHTYIASVVQDPETGIWYYHYVVYEGTGRYDGVYGDIYMFGTIDFVSFTYNLEGEGTITY